MSNSEPQEVNFNTVRDQAPEVAAFLISLREGIEAYNGLQEELTAHQSESPLDFEDRVRAAQEAIAKAMDNIQATAPAHQENPAVMTVVQAAMTEGMAYMQSIVFALHFTRVSAAAHAQPFRRLVAEGYHMIERQTTRLKASEESRG